MRQRRVAAIHDISCFGKCSLTVALPIISACGAETAVIPTAVLSTHTGGFKNFTFRDLTDDLLAIARHWKSEGITFDALYTGYLGSKAQAEIVCQIIDEIRNEDTKVIVDPGMADNGKLYTGFDGDFPLQMKKLCMKADIITPNITEASLLLGIPFRQAPHGRDYIESTVCKLAELTGKSVVLTGVCPDDSRIGAAVFDVAGIDYCFAERVPSSYHGTGDIFASTLTGALMNGKTLKEATEAAVKFTRSCIERTFKDHGEMRYGVNFESELSNLMKLLNR